MGRMIAIIGAGGDRDATKRPLMAAEAVANADFVIVSDDNPAAKTRNNPSNGHGGGKVQHHP